MPASSQDRPPILNILQQRQHIRESRHVSARREVIPKLYPRVGRTIQGYFLGNHLPTVEIVPVPLRHSYTDYEYPESLMVDMWINTHVESGIHMFNQCLTTWHHDGVHYHVFRDRPLAARTHPNPFLSNQIQGNTLVITESTNGLILDASEQQIDQLLRTLSQFYCSA
ncbi:hypothetical protein AAF712_016060 [Marasmius tenuissimus]|uniref:Uncharacterized protein n=1 Tax=Marasmius tenuissimus TaxID=585030 RepID=A0ABR2Z6N0_9AGAR